MNSAGGRWILSFALVCSAFFCGSASAQDTNAYLYLVNAVPGREISASTNPAFPVDVLVDGSVCLAKDVAFGEIRGPFTATAGAYTFAISHSNSASPCSNPAIYSVTISFGAGNSYFGLLVPDGSGGVVGQIYQADLSSIPAGSSRVMVANATSQDLTASLAGSGGTVGVPVPADTMQEGVVPSGTYSGSVYLMGTSTLEAGPQSADLMSRDLYFYVLAGSASNSSVQIIGPKAIKDVF